MPISTRRSTRAQREARAAFGDPRVLIEKYVAAPRHIEMQVFADAHGNVVHLFERDCSLQRRHQKVIEEAPAPGHDAGAARAPWARPRSRRRARSAMSGAGTVEFIADGARGLRPDGFYFMEMNTRLQVEHPVTEAITGLDLVEWQFRVAAGEPLPLDAGGSADRRPCGRGAALCRRPGDTASCPRPASSSRSSCPTGEGMRVDTGVAEGDEVTPFYDPMIAKIIAHGASRDEALDRLSRRARRTVVAGPKTQRRLPEGACRRARNSAKAPSIPASSTAIWNGLGAPEAARCGGDCRGTAHSCAWSMRKRTRRFSCAAGWAHKNGSAILGAHARASSRRPGTRSCRSRPSGKVDVELFFDEDGPHLPRPAKDRGLAANRVERDAAPRRARRRQRRRRAGRDKVFVIRNGRQTTVALVDPLDVDLDHLDGDASGQVKSPMHGKLVALLVSEGEAVTKGQLLAVVEAMKMEHALTSPRTACVGGDGEAGEQVAEGARLMTVMTAQA